ncbi:MAG: tetratricopeptide repeat protein [Phycisphaerae bacterium]|nr:tetratricopeptide repeat protein [Phycisphaerae bacterium]
MAKGKIYLVALLLVASAMPVLGSTISTQIREGVYKEEVEGDLDAAIKIYEGIITAHADNQRYAAQATYRLGLCYLKKGQNDKAIEQFERIVKDYPTEKTTARKAEQQLKKLKPANKDEGSMMMGDPRKPSVIDSFPKTYSNDVSADVDKLTVTFDQPMIKENFSWVKWNYTFPETPGKPYYDEKATTCTLPVKLEPGTAYLLRINAKQYSNFMNLDGVRAQPFVLVFATKDKDGKPTTIPEEMLKFAKYINGLNPTSNKLAAENLAGQGWELWQQRKLAEAEEKFKEAIDKDAGCENAYQGLGWAQLNQGKKANAKDSFEKCIKLNANNSAALNGLGWIGHGEGKTDEAIEWWEKAVKAQPGATASLNGLTQVYMERKDYEKALKYYDMWLKVEPNKEKIREIEIQAGNIRGMKEFRDRTIKNLLKDLEDSRITQPGKFKTLNSLIEIGTPAVELLIEELDKSNNWQVAKALGAIKDKRAVGPLIRKWEKANESPMNDVIAEALGIITGNKFGKDLKAWQDWYAVTEKYITPEATLRGFMSAAADMDSKKAMSFVAVDSHDYEDIKKIFDNPKHPFNTMFKKLDNSKLEIVKVNIIDNMCSAVWRVTFKEDCDLGKATFKAGDTYDIDGNLNKSKDKWLITGI